MEIDGAVRNAIASASKLLGAERTIDIRLEEVESSIVDDKPVFLITLSSDGYPAGRIHPIRVAALGADSEREYKVFTVAKDTGEVVSMKIRLLALPGA